MTLGEGGAMKLAVIGLDCATPQLVFERFLPELPTISRLMKEGTWGPLESCDPPITVPAWTAMMSGFDPGQLGIYGFRNRKDHSYDGYTTANASAVKVDRVWDVLSRHGRRVILLGVPQTYPIRPLNGCVVSDFLTPSTRSAYTHPPELKAEVERVSGGYVFDVEGVRTPDKAALLARTYDKTRKHFAVARHLVTTQPWDFFMMVEMGVDRIHHGFWSYMEPTHRKYEVGHALEHAIREYYRYVDDEVGRLLSLMPEDTVMLVVSDHGAKTLEGGICFNEWLIREGYLVLKARPSSITPIDKAEIDWSRTRAWGDGGYYGRLFMNVRGREPQGCIDLADYERVRDELIARIETIEDPEGHRIGSRACRPQDLYREVNGVPPDLIVYFGDLRWRSIGAVGYPGIHTFDNDTGPDEANHAKFGIFIHRDPRLRGRGRVEGLRLVDVGPSLLGLFGLPAPAGGVGQATLFA
jgi:predicted AlkP superfamily phosphohydrolase/phosphomutase